MIVEGLMTTLGPDGSPHVAPMGPVVDERFEAWTLRPFQTSTTFENLQRAPKAVFQVVDDVLPVVQAMLGLDPELEFDHSLCDVPVVSSACRWFRLEVTAWNLDHQRSEATAVVHQQGDLRPFWGWNRGKHAVLEAAILVSRRHMIAADELQTELARLQPAVEKTAGTRERTAWRLLSEFLKNASEEAGRV